MRDGPHPVIKRVQRFRATRYLRWGLIHTALIIFFADLIAAVWPAFHAVWEGHAHIAIAVAAFTATVAEYFHDDEEGRGK